MQSLGVDPGPRNKSLGATRYEYASLPPLTPLNSLLIGERQTM